MKKAPFLYYISVVLKEANFLILTSYLDRSYVMGKLYVVGPSRIGVIKPELYGHFAEHIGGVIYDGIYVGKDSKVENVNGFRKEIIDKLKAINAPVVRWPGGCFAEIYDWRDGIGKDRPTRVNWWTKNDGRYETNEVGTHEFASFCDLVGAKPYFAANLTTVNPLTVRDWIDYTTTPEGKTTLAKEREANGHKEPFDIPWWGIGNENWGGGGNMTPEYYALEFRRYATVACNTNPNIKCIACGPDGENWEWTRRFLEVAREKPELIDGLALHYYRFNWKDDVIKIEESDWYRMLWQAARVQYLIARHWAYVVGYGLDRRVKLYIDEWGAWHRKDLNHGYGPTMGANLFEQQSTVRDAAMSAIYLNAFNNNCDKVDMANAAQVVNNLHCLFLANGENCITTPTYHVFDMFKTHMGGEALRTENTFGTLTFKGARGEDLLLSRVYSSASFKDGRLTVTAVNTSPNEAIDLELCTVGFEPDGDGTYSVLQGVDINDHNTFEEPERVKPRVYELKKEDIGSISVPAASVISIVIPVKDCRA